MKTWDEICREALGMYLHRDRYCYFYGAKGQVLTDAVMNALWNAEPAYFSKYNAQQKAAIFNYSRGKIGLDCSGFVSYLTGFKMYSTGMINSCDHVSGDIKNGPAGSIVYTTWGGKGRHVGLDIGYGFTLSIDKEGDSIVMRRTKEGNIWEKTGRLSKYIDYKGADAR